MNSNLVFTNNSGKEVTTSLIVSAVFGKDHDKVIRDIQSLHCSKEFNTANFGVISYQDSMNRVRQAYELTKDGFSFLVMGYTGDKAGEFKEKFIAAFNKMESMLKSDDFILDRAIQILKNRLELQQRQLELANQTIEKQAPKVEYFDNVLQSKGLIATNIIAKDLGMSAMALNKQLHAKGIIYQCQGVWVPYSKYQDQGYSHSQTFPVHDKQGNPITAIHYYWTEKGREFIMRLFQLQKTA
jgi:Rha family phage regulatory protein